MCNKIARILLLFSLLFFSSCEITLFGDGDENGTEVENPENENGDEPEEELTFEELPDFCDVQSIEGWTNVRFCKNGTVIFTKNYDGTESVNKALLFVPVKDSLSSNVVSIYGEYDESGFPKYLSFDDAVVFVEDYKDGLVDLTLIQGEECMWGAEDLELNPSETVSTRAWGDNNWVRNTCAVGGVITSSIGIGAGVAVTAASGGLGGVLGGGTMILKSSKELVKNLDVLFGTGGDFVFSEYAIGKMEGICMETMVDMLLENEESYLQTLWPDKFNFNKGAPNVPSTFWLDLAMEVVDAKWGKTVTEADKRRAFIIAHLGYKIVTGRADDIKQNSATLYGYISPEAMLPLNKFAEVEYGIVLYPTGDENARMHESYYSAEGGQFYITFRRLEPDTEYSYFTYYYDKTNYAYRQGDVNTFKTKGETSDLRELLMQFYYDTGGDNWFNNDNWCTDAPLNEWYGVTLYEDGDEVKLRLSLYYNNLIGSGTLSGCTSLVELYCYNNQLTNLDVSGCTSLEYLHCEENQLTNLDVSGCTSLEYLQCEENQLTNLDVSGCTSLVRVDCYNNQLTSLDASGCTSLVELSCSILQLTSLDISGCTSLETLYCHGNQLTSLDVSGCTSLETLYCHENQLTSMNVSGCTSLRQLSCYGNQLTSLNVSGCTSLRDLSCHSNQLTSLDVSGCTSLETLSCFENQLTSLDASGCTSLEALHCSNNKITQVITDFYHKLWQFSYDQRYTDYHYESIYDSKGNKIGEELRYKDNGVGWWYPGEPQKGYHGE